MKTERIQSLTNNFEAHARQTENGVEFWLARDLQRLFGYEKWDNFKSVIAKAKIACEVSGYKVFDHFAGVGKTIKMPKSAEKTVDDFMLTRYACYLIAQNGDPRKEEIAFAQNIISRCKPENLKLLKSGFWNLLLKLLSLIAKPIKGLKNPKFLDDK